MKYLFNIIICFIGILLISCSHLFKGEPENVKEKPMFVSDQKDEDFNIFIKQFQNDSVFQNSRIVFPLRTLSYNTDTENWEEKLINNNREWGFMNFSKLPNNYLRIINKKTDTEVAYNIQIIDTGVSVDYCFKIKDGKWYLIEIKDEST